MTDKLWYVAVLSGMGAGVTFCYKDVISRHRVHDQIVVAV